MRQRIFPTAHFYSFNLASAAAAIVAAVTTVVVAATAATAKNNEEKDHENDAPAVISSEARITHN